MSDPVEAVARAFAREWATKVYEDSPEAFVGYSEAEIVAAIQRTAERELDKWYPFARAAIAAYHKALEADGWQVVPREPT